MRAVRCSAVAAVLLLVALLTGCVSDWGHYDFEFEASDAVGRWSAETGDEVVALEFRGDGTFTAEGWPTGLSCAGVLPEPDDDPDDLWDETVDFSGTWEGDAPGEEYAIRLLSPGPECRSNFSVVAWTDPGGPTRLRVELSPLTPLEELTDDMVLYLEKEQSDSPL
ncbi:hypothetical protein [Microbacterium aurugineum]